MFIRNVNLCFFLYIKTSTQNLEGLNEFIYVWIKIAIMDGLERKTT